MVAMPSGLEAASREDLLALIGVLQDHNTALRQQVTQQQTEIAQLRADNERLPARVTELERRLGRNSANSSLPPSLDLFAQPEKKPSTKSGRKRGRQKGAQGFGLSMVEDPNQTLDHVPGACSGCGHGLNSTASTGYQRRQIRDIPLVTEHRAHTLGILRGSVTSTNGTEIAVDADTICVHGDRPNGVEVAEAITRAFAKEGVRMAPMAEVLAARGA